MARLLVTSRWLIACALVALGSGCVTTNASSAPVVSIKHQEPELLLVRHTVEPGQTLYRIARAYGITLAELTKANHLEDPRELKVGESLWIPGATSLRKVADADAQEPIAVRPASKTPAEKSDKPEKHVVVKATKVGKIDGVLQWPLRGVLYARFGKKGGEPHDGIDLAAPSGTTVKTAQSGNVLYAGEQQGYGLIVIVEHDHDLITLYAHNRDLRVKTGQKVRDGQVVATVGDSGKTSGPHLHFEVRKDGVPVDPLEFLGPVPSANDRG